MTSIRRVTVIGTAGILGLCLLGLRLRTRPSLPPTPRSIAPQPRSAAEAALRRAAQYRTRAKLAASDQRGELEDWDPQASTGLDAEEWRLQQLVRDRDGHLRQAQRWAREAARLARTRGEAYQAAELLVLLDHERGDHEAELRRARELIELAPGSARARMVLRRAEECYRRRAGRTGAFGASPPAPK